jgi:hypothetical protein
MPPLRRSEPAATVTNALSAFSKPFCRPRCLASVASLGQLTGRPRWCRTSVKATFMRPLSTAP